RFPLLVRQHPAGLRLIGGRHDDRAFQLALAAAVLARQDVLFEGFAPDEFPGCSLLEALGGAAMTLEFWHYAFSVSALTFAAAGFLPPTFCDRIVCIWLPSCRGMFSGVATSARSSISRSRMRRPISGCAISRPRKKIVAFTLSPSARKRSMCFFLNW